jgi:ABC-type transporter Mla maintaining outer membrane lipid asymmetry ATPase subunit MlaF
MKWPFETLAVGSFRGLRDLKLEGLGRVNLLVGGSNSGKTSVLEAISLLSNPMDPLVWIHTANRREPSPLAAMTSSKVDRIRYLFPVDQGGEQPIVGEIRIDVTGPTAIDSVVANLSELRGMRAQRNIFETDESGANEIVAEVERTGLEIAVQATTAQGLLFAEPRVFQIWEGESIYRTSRAQPRLPVRTVTPYEHWLRQPATKGFSDAVLTGNERRTLELIKRIEPNIMDVRVLATQREPMLYLKDARAGFLPVSSFGDGIRRILTLALALPRAANGVLLIDEIETGLHVSLVENVYSWIVAACHEFNVQLFTTTHSLEAVDALINADTTEDEDTVCFQLSRTLDKQLIKRFGEKQLRRLRGERGLDLR